MARRNKSGLDKGFDTEPPGSVWRHSKTGGWYWKILTVRIPPSYAGRGRYTSIPLVPVGRKTATKLKGVALKRRRQLWRQWSADGQKDSPRIISRWIDEFQQWNASHASARQARYNADVARKFAKHQGIRHAWDITPKHVQAYLQALTLSPGTIHHHRNALSKFGNYLVACEQLESNPARHPLVQLPPVRRTPVRYLTENQVSTLLEFLREHHEALYAPVVFCLETGARLGEMQAVRWRDARDGQVMLQSGKAKDSQPYRYVPISPDLQQVLDRLPRDGEFIFPRRDKRRWVRMMSRATKTLPVFGELPGRRAGNQWHLCRSTWAVRLARSGATLWRLMALGGWSQPQTVMRYVNLARAAGMV